MNWFISNQDFIDLWNTRIQQMVDNHQERYQNVIGKFNDLIGPSSVYHEFQQHTHNSLLDLMDKKNFILLRSQASQLDMARMYSILKKILMKCYWMMMIENFQNHFFFFFFF